MVYHEIILSLSQDQLKTSSYDSDLQHAKISVRNIVRYNLQTLSQTILVFASESYQENSCVLRKIVFFKLHVNRNFGIILRLSLPHHQGKSTKKHQMKR